MSCASCEGARYTFVTWIERKLKERGMHLTDMPRDMIKSCGLGFEIR